MALDLADSLSNRELARFLAPLLVDRAREVRFRATEAVGSYRLTGLLRSAVRQLRDPDWLVRAAAVESLRRIGLTGACRALFGALSDTHPIVRGDAAEALAEIGCRHAGARLLAALSHERSPAAKLRLHWALARLGRVEHLPEVAGFLCSGDYRLRCASVHGLVELSNTANAAEIAGALTGALCDEPTRAVRCAIREALKVVTQKRRHEGVSQ